MSSSERFPQTEQKAQETLDRMASALAEASAAVAPSETGKSLLEIFPEPGERRTDTKFALPPEEEAAFRAAMAKIGIGRETNMGANEVGLTSDYVAVIEGGLGHKIAAELSVVLSDTEVYPSAIIIAATPDRELPPVETDKAKERMFAATILGKNVGEVGNTEYDVAEQIANSLPGFVEVPFHEDMHPEQFKRIGIITLGEEGIPIIMLRLNRQPLEGGRYKQPGTSDVLKMVAAAMPEDSPNPDIGFVTSSTYQPSREIDAVSTMLEMERQGAFRNIGVVTYGTHELAQVKRIQVPQPPELASLASEAYKAAQQVGILRNLLDQT